jgi:hypothetical protein
MGAWSSAQSDCDSNLLFVRNYHKFLTNLAFMSQLALSILNAIQTLHEGGLLAPKEFLHLGSRAAVDQTLTRLTREGQLLRVGRGMYALPVPGRFGSRAPSTESVVEAIESAQGEAIVPNGAAEANALGLTMQVPVREVFLTAGPSKMLHLGQRSVELQHAKRWLLVLGKRPAGKAIRALSWLGPQEATTAARILHAQFPPDEWSALRAARALLPSWMARAVSEASVGNAHG